MDQDIKQQSEQLHITSLTGFLKDVMRLSRYAAECGRLPEEIQMDELYRMWDIKISRQGTLSDEDIAYLQNCYQILSRQLAPTTAVSLRATERKQDSESKDYMKTDAGRHVRNMWFASFCSLTIIVLMSLYQYIFEFNSAAWAVEDSRIFNNATYLYSLVTTLMPFMYGAFGASVYMLRQAESYLKDRTFDPRRVPEFRNRLVLGTLSGGIIVLLYSSGGLVETNVKITEAALGFIGGYSIDLLFSLLDRIVNSLKPDEASTPAPPLTSAPSLASPHKKAQSTTPSTKNPKEEKESVPQLVTVNHKEGDNIA